VEYSVDDSAASIRHIGGNRYMSNGESGNGGFTLIGSTEPLETTDTINGQIKVITLHLIDWELGEGEGNIGLSLFKSF